MQVAVVISTWIGNPPDYLLRLIDSMEQYPSGYSYDLFICANGLEYQLPENIKEHFVKVFVRENIGFNLGAWDYAWRNLPGYDHFLFLQDDCFIRQRNWLKCYVDYYNTTQHVGLVGEHSNKSWAHPWAAMMTNSQGEFTAKKATRAQQFYAALKYYGIDPGEYATHITTVVQFVSRKVLEAVNGYQIAEEYNLAIAAEIGFSKKVESIGCSIHQISRYRHQLIGHPQWPSDEKKE